MRHFNIAGPCNKTEHYMIDAPSRLKRAEQLIYRNQYFVIHAPHRSGKTTYLLDLAQRLNASGKYYTLYCSLEMAQGIDDPETGILAIVRAIQNALCLSGVPNGAEFAGNADYGYIGVLEAELVLFCNQLDKPFVILFDDTDCLHKTVLTPFLRQLRSGYNSRDSHCRFVHSIALAGTRDICKCDDAEVPFNIVAESLTLQNFTEEEICMLYRQHTDETRQVFEDDVIELVFDISPRLKSGDSHPAPSDSRDSCFGLPSTAPNCVLHGLHRRIKELLNY
jgi:hypothetical protein